jgi:hypothetical protein
MVSTIPHTLGCRALAGYLLTPGFPWTHPRTTVPFDRPEIVSVADVEGGADLLAEMPARPAHKDGAIKPWSWRKYQKINSPWIR